MRTPFALAAVCVVLSLSGGAAAQPNDDGPSGVVAKRLKELVPKIREEKRLVSLGAMVLVKGEVIGSAVSGERKKGSKNAVEVGDRWHLGSITKSMTATMIARLVERKSLAWSFTVGECFGESLKLHPDWRDVTLEQLLTHTSGATPNFPTTVQFQRPPEGKQRVTARREAVANVLAKKPMLPPGKQFQYSNVGFTIAAALIEKETGSSWEDLVRKEIFAPLGASKAGFGPPKSSKDKLDQPRGHQKLGPFKRAMREDSDNSPIMGPAGTVHMTLRELCNFGYEHVAGERGKGKLLKAETYQRLHSPKLNDYAFGWVAPKKNKWTAGKIVWHNGSNTMWYALLALLPDRDMVIAVTSNDGDIKSAEAGAFHIVREIAKTR